MKKFLTPCLAIIAVVAIVLCFVFAGQRGEKADAVTAKVNAAVEEAKKAGDDALAAAVEEAKKAGDTAVATAVEEAKKASDEALKAAQDAAAATQAEL